MPTSAASRRASASRTRRRRRRRPCCRAPASRPRRSSSPPASRGAGTRLPPPYYRGARPRRPLWPWLLAALLLGLAGVAGYFVYHEVDQRLPATPPSRSRSSRGSPRASHATRSQRRPRADRPAAAEREVAAGDRLRPEPRGRQPRQQGRPGRAHRLSRQAEGRGAGRHGRVGPVRGRGADETRANPKEYEVTSSQEPGTVTGQSPAPGTQVVKGTTVRINVSQGLPPVIIPSDLIGKSQSDATSELQGSASTFDATAGSTKPQGTVSYTNPKPGSSVQRGSQVTLLVSRGRRRPSCRTSRLRRRARGQTIGRPGSRPPSSRRT